MIKNYFKIGWRNLFKNKFYSLINIAGLTAGLAIGILILLWVQDELSFDSFHHKAKNIYRVNTHIGTGNSKQVWEITQAPVATYAKKEVPGVVNAVRIAHNYDHDVFTWQNKTLKDNGSAYTDPSFFQMFDFRLLRGNPKNPFPNNQSVVITQSVAKKYFGTENPMGKVLQADHKENFTVSGVLEDFPGNSSINYDMLFPMDIMVKSFDGTGFWKSLDSDWGNFGYTTFLEVQPNASLKNIGEELIRIQLKNAPHIKVTVADNPFELQLLENIHLYKADGTSSGMQTVKIFAVVAFLILLIACINYVNLSTARSILRAKEVSIRKIIGAQKKQLFFQFIIESVIFFSISLLLAFVLIALLMPFYNQLSGKNVHLNLLDTSVWKVILLTIMGTLLASAIYPSLLLTSFDPLKSLKGKLTLGVGNTAFRKILVTTQFVFSVVLIISTLIIGQQLKYIREKNPGYQRDQVFAFNMGNIQKYLSVNAIKAELKTEPNIIALSATAGNLINNGNTTGDNSWDGKDRNNSFIVSPLGVDAAFIPMMKMKLQSGSNFSGIQSDSAHFLLNETAVKMMGINNPVGKRFKLWETEGTIIGVVKDFNFASLKEAIKPSVIFYKDNGYRLYVKTTGNGAAKALAATKKLWDQYNPGIPFEYSFLDEAYGKLYQSDQRTGTLFNIFSVIAILISCLGLFGLATYTAQIMTKEIGIRKVLGASVSSIVTLVSKDFLKLILLAIVIASPIAFFTMQKWLQDFAYRIQISWRVFALAGILALLIALITISFQAIKAALANPVKSLRSE
jgi:putative ABC transport system permease protein